MASFFEFFIIIIIPQLLLYKSFNSDFKDTTETFKKENITTTFLLHTALIPLKSTIFTEKS